MNKAQNNILTVAQMRAAEQALIDDGETVWSLMLRAGTGAADYIWRISAGRQVTVLCGPGNNGGDGYVIAESLRRRGCPVKLLAAFDPATEAAQQARSEYHGPIVEEQDAVGDLLVDCLFGSGLTRALGADLSGLLARLAQKHGTRIAIDVPSGVQSDHAAPLDDDLPTYDCTVALGAWKLAHWLMPAMEMMGERRLVLIGIGPKSDAARLLARPDLSAPPRDAHKYSRGLLALVGGAMPGAIMLSARAAMHGGAGYVKLLSDNATAVPAELVVDGSDLDDALEDSRISALAIGPGLGRSGRGRNKLSAVLARNLPTLCDADALILLKPDMLARRSAPLILTPHAGELDRLFDQFGVGGGDRLESLHELAESTGAVIVAKGPDTIIAGPGRRTVIAPAASSWLSTAGTGDVLAGLIASQLAVSEDAFAAACAGVWLHGDASRRLLPPFTAADLVDSLREAYAACL
ncbi:NAD(P)H-hydrate dehydratase [Altericroceibacterium endophyticum]|uniref:ADP-dependent (S)-NAD(P)H-hydrate dehydratase n=1 Tax=Altericroceibacterium endophyticum TaxID=1808508 RepID=A0A6I4T859_9SPHN|nr:NAD(P)H-hydrate dehydratase [Altericroceibacterium endophyticum]MXO66040.1 NAD(P)H-hydrate dehydratase [Altericroceibacterium endophyticum]